MFSSFFGVVIIFAPFYFGSRVPLVVACLPTRLCYKASYACTPGHRCTRAALHQHHIIYLLPTNPGAARGSTQPLLYLQMQFSEVIGQIKVRDQLVSMVQHNRVSHAQLFLASEGTGGLPMALAFAQYIVCEQVRATRNPQSTSGIGLFGDEGVEEKAFPTEACGKCSACTKAAQFIHPDIHFSFPIFVRKPGEKPTCDMFMAKYREFLKLSPYSNNYDWLQFAGAENKQGNINVHECQDIIRKLSLKSFESDYKILIMWMPEMMGNEGNRLLKLIEEPPANTLFIFVAENEERILQTIQSRTQLIKFPPLAPKDIELALMERNNCAPELAKQLSVIAHGNYHEAVKMLQHADDSYEVMLRTWLNAIVTVNLSAQMKWIDAMSKTGREPQKQFLQYFTQLMQQSIRLSTVPDEQASTSDFAQRLTNICDVSQLAAIIEEIEKAIYYIERNANPKMLFHALTIKIYHVIKHRVVMEVI